MNCQELTQLLDDGDIRNLPPAKRRELDAHLSGCAECAAEWRVQERIVIAPVPRTPPGFVELCRRLVEAGVARLLPRRVVLYSAALVLAAAAAMLAWREWAPVADFAKIAAEPAVAVALPGPELVLPVPEPDALAEPAPVPQVQPVAPPPGTFFVMVPPIQFEGADSVGQTIALRFRDRVIELLQGLPNLVLVDAPFSEGLGAAEFEVRMKYSGSTAPTSRTVNLDIRSAAEIAATRAAIAAEARMSPEDRQRSQQQRQLSDALKQHASLSRGNLNLTLLLGTGVPRMATIDAILAPPGDRVEYAAQTLVRDLQIHVFPVDESFEQEQLATLCDPAQRAVLRRQALGALLSYAERRGGIQQASPAVVRAGGELALIWEGQTSTDRTMIWDGLALTGNPELVPYLIRGLNEAPHTETRLRLVKILAAHFTDDPRAHAALAAAATSNDRQTVRMAAVRESGGSQWNEYVVATLQDSGLPDLERLQPVADMAPGELGSLGTSPKSKLALDDHQLRELGALVIRLAPDSSVSETVQKALFAAGAMETPGALDMLIHVLQSARLQDAPPGVSRVSIMAARQTASGLIAYRYGDNPKGRALIEQLAGSADPMESVTAQPLLDLLNSKAAMQKALGNRQP